MNIIFSMSRTIVLWLLLSFGVGTANAESSGILQLQKIFPDSIKLYVDNKQSLEFCPDNTCDIFVTKRSTSSEVLNDFAFLYLYFFYDYFALADWHSDEVVETSVAAVLKKYDGDKCANKSSAMMAQCLLRSWAMRNAIRLYWVRFDEKGRHLLARNVREATKLK